MTRRGSAPAACPAWASPCASCSAYSTMKGVMIPGVSAGSNQVGASEMCTPQVSCPSGPTAMAGPGAPTSRARAKRAITCRRVVRSGAHPAPGRSAPQDGRETEPEMVVRSVAVIGHRFLLVREADGSLSGCELPEKPGCAKRPASLSPLMRCARAGVLGPQAGAPYFGKVRRVLSRRFATTCFLGHSGYGAPFIENRDGSQHSMCFLSCEGADAPGLVSQKQKRRLPSPRQQRLLPRAS